MCWCTTASCPSIRISKVLVRDGQKGKETRESYDQLMIAVGAEPIRPPLDGIEAEGIYGVATLESGMEVARFIDGQKPGRAVIIGGGYIGLEMAEALVLREMEVSLVEAGPEVMGTLDPDMGRLVSEALMDIGVTLYREERVEGFEKKGNRVRAVNTDERTLPADLVILGMGVQPSVSLAEDAGIPLGESGAIRVNTRMQTDSENIWAGGDCAESFHIVSRRPMHIALGTVANRHGRTAGINIGGGYAAFRGIVGTAVSKVCSLEVARTGLQEKEIQALGLEHVSSRIESTTRAGYYPDAGPMTVKVLAEKGSGRLLGGQIVGKEGSAKRIDILATAIHAGMAVDEVANLDLGYAPPFSPLWDPVIIGARITTKEL
jgi:NADPH-dependent 2,4-dienoyl-CoA reductase/sulfur reductase-like enzyme